jgi:hypothetical protein
LRPLEADFGNFRIDFLSKFKAMCDSALVHVSEPCGLFDEKTKGQKFRDTVPLNKGSISVFMPITQSPPQYDISKKSGHPSGDAVLILMEEANKR